MVIKPLQMMLIIGAIVPAADNSLANTSAAYAQVNLGRRKISEVGLAAIGVGDGELK